MKVQQSAVLQPSVSQNNERKLEAVIGKDNNIELKLSTWSEDLGWLCQKTIAVEPEMLDDLHRTIAALRYRVNSDKIRQGETVADNKVIDFPSFL